MSAPIVYEGVPRSHDGNTQDRSSLFANTKIWFSHSIPQRQWLITNAQANGAVIVDRDTDADIRLVDHARKNNAPGTYSYQYVEKSIRNGQLEDLARYAIGASSHASRAIGSTVTAPKPGRTPFTLEDDRLLWKWIGPLYDQGAWKGNEIYKQLAEVNPRHTYQSWRDRFIKYTRFQNRPVSDKVAAAEFSQVTREARSPQPSTPRKRRRDVNDDGEAQRADISREAGRGSQTRNILATSTSTLNTPRSSKHPQATEPKASSLSNTTPARERTTAASVDDRSSTRPSIKPQATHSRPFTKDEYDQLYSLLSTTVGYHFEDFEDSWEEFAQVYDTHTATEWKQYFISTIIPDYCKANGRSVEEVAPWLSEPSEDKKSHALEDLEEQEHTQAASESSSSEGLTCTVCFTTDAGKWHQNNEGKVVCHDCHKLPKSGRSNRPSIVLEDGDRKDLATMTAGHDRGILSRLIDHENLAVQTEQAALSLANNTAGPSQHEIQLGPEDQPEVGSPSFRPESPAYSRPPEPNESRKRSAGKGSQSQSTQSSSLNTFPSTQSQDRNAVASQSLASSMGQDQSKESQTQTVTASAGGPKFQASSKRNQRRLQDEPGILPTQQNSSLSTDDGPPRIRSVDPSGNSDESNERVNTAPTNSTLTSLGQGSGQATSDLFSLFETDDRADEDVEPRESQNVEDEHLLSPLHVDLLSDRHEITVDNESDPESGVKDTETDEDLDADFANLVPPSKRQKTEEFETAQQTPEEFETAREEQDPGGFRSEAGIRASAFFNEELNAEDDMTNLDLPEPPGGFEAYGIEGLSATAGYADVRRDRSYVPESPDSRHHDLDIGLEQTELRDESPEIKLEDDSYLELPDVPILSQISPLLAASEPPGTVNAEHEDDARTESDPEEQRPRPSEEDHTQTQPQAPPATRGPSPKDDEPIDQAAPDSPAECGLAIDDWLAQQHALHPNTPDLDSILFPAVEATCFDFSLATEVVKAMLDNRERQGRRTGLHDVEVEALLPRDVRGVWTQADDSDLVSGMETAQNRVWAKHGRAGCVDRFEFLRGLNQD